MKDWAAWVGSKYGTLTVEKYLGKKKNNQALFSVRCACGKTKKVIASDFVRGKAKSCGRLECKRAVANAKLLDLPKPLEDDSAPTYSSAIEERIRPKYFCRAVALECTISTLLHICCCECDRPCKRCKNTPQKCGARRRRTH